MFRLGKILFPVDFSERSHLAAAHARALAIRFHAELTLLHVIQPVSYNSQLSEASGSLWDPYHRIFQDADLKVSNLTERGDVAAKIMEIAHREEVDLILMPTHGLGVYRRLILGSNTAKILHDAECPVWTPAHQETSGTPEHLSVQRVLCAVNMEPSSKRVLEWAAGYAAGHAARLTLLQVATNSLEARRWLEDLRRLTGLDAEISVESGDPADVIPEVARGGGFDTLVVGRPISEPGWGRLKGTTYSIIRQSSCPVVSV